MKRIILLLIFLTSISAFAQDFIDKTFIVNQIIGADMQNAEQFILYENQDKEESLGLFVKFSVNKEMESWYSAPCGNDCFPATYGSYEIIDENHIAIFISRFVQRGDCIQFNQKINKRLGIYYIHKVSKNEIHLIKSEENIKEEIEKIEFSEKLANFFKIILNKMNSSYGKVFYSSNLSWRQQADKYAKEELHLKNYKICISGKKRGYTFAYLVKDLDTNAYFYIIAHSQNQKIGLYHFTDAEVNTFQEYYQKVYERRK